MSFFVESFNKLLSFVEGTDEVEYIGRYEHIFVGQRFSWDCGLACCAMALRYLSHESEDVYSSGLGFRQSPLWTIELFCLLREKVDCEMFTTSVGIEPHHLTQDWYKACIDADCTTVTKSIVVASENGWTRDIHTTPIELEDLKTCLALKTTCAIVLVHSGALSLSDDQLAGDTSAPFVGHYIFLLSYDPAQDQFSYFNPSFQNNVVQCVSSALLDFARSYPGSDNDVIVCRVEEDL